ncbi:MAG: ECF transporter S component [Clostridiales bacterium]|nr:ECF transporter S component [Clostridiales bacterium]
MKSRIKSIVICSLFTALTFVFTAYLHIPLGTGQYIHPGDAFIFIASCLLPFPLGSLTGVLGGALADILTGYAYWAPFTAVIKFLMSILFSSKGKKFLSKSNILRTVIAGLISTAGYYLATVAVILLGLGSYGSEGESLLSVFGFAAIDSVPGSLIQGVASIILFVLIAKSFDSFDLKARLEGGTKI